MLRKLFGLKKRKTAKELGQLLYQVIQMGLRDGMPSSFPVLLNQLDLTEIDLVEHHPIEVISALMFQVILAVEKKYDYPIAGEVINGMVQEFSIHTKEMGNSQENVEYVLSLFNDRKKEYRIVEKTNGEEGSAYWLGKLYFEKLTYNTTYDTKANTHDKRSYIIHEHKTPDSCLEM